MNNAEEYHVKPPKTNFPTLSFTILVSSAINRNNNTCQKVAIFSYDLAQCVHFCF